MWKTVPRPEIHGFGKTRDRWLSKVAHYQPAPVFKPASGGNALGSLPSLVRVPSQLPGTWLFSS